MSDLRASISPLERLEEILPPALEGVSIGRAQLIVDQLRSNVADHRERIRLIEITDSSARSLAAAILLWADETRSLQSSRSATVLHAGIVHPAAPIPPRDIAQALQHSLAASFAEQDVDFAQWATDPTSESSLSAQWCRGLGFEHLADLEYLSCSTDDLEPTAPQSSLRFEPIDWNPAALESFAKLVEATYLDTLDCPRITQFRSARQTLAGYEQSATLDKNGWFRVFENSPNQSQPIGSLILANHHNGTNTQVTELVYMGLVPAARGNGWGTLLLDECCRQAANAHSQHVVLAVDLANDPARQIYLSKGFRGMMQESVWGWGKHHASANP